MPRRSKNAPPPEPTQDTHVYLPLTIHERIAEIARQNRRSLNAEIVLCLERCLDSLQPQAS